MTHHAKDVLYPQWEPACGSSHHHDCDYSEGVQVGDMRVFGSQTQFREIAQPPLPWYKSEADAQAAMAWMFFLVLACALAAVMVFAIWSLIKDVILFFGRDGFEEEEEICAAADHEDTP